MRYRVYATAVVIGRPIERKRERSALLGGARGGRDRDHILQGREIILV